MAEKEYIERDSIYSRVKAHTNPYGKPTLDYESGVKVLDMIKQEPAADVVEVRHGKWIEHDQYICNSDDEPVAKIGTIFICSECSRAETNKEPYCHCGAKMDGATDNNVGDKRRC